MSFLVRAQSPEPWVYEFKSTVPIHEYRYIYAYRVFELRSDVWSSGEKGNLLRSIRVEAKCDRT